MVDQALVWLSARLLPLWQLRVWAHAGVLTIIVALLVPTMNLTESGWVDDEGMYALQVHALDEGSWEYDYAGSEFDPSGEWFPIVRGERFDGRFFTYTKHPAYVALLFGATRVFGMGTGLFVVPMLGLVLSAIGAWFLAGQVDQRFSRPAFWIAAATPLAVNGYLIWAHTLSAAIATLVFVMAVKIARSGPTIGRLLAFSVGALAGVLVRSEMLLFVGAVTLGLAVIATRRRSFATTGLVVGLGSAAAAAALLAERWMITRIMGPGGGEGFRGVRGDFAGSGWIDVITDRVGAAARIVFYGDGSLFSEAGTPLIVALAFAAFAGIMLRVHRDELLTNVGTAAAVIALLVVLYLYGDRFSVYRITPANGLFAAWPLAIVGFASLQWRGTGFVERFLLAVAGLYAAAVFATQYSVGGSAEWGGRFLSPIVPAVAVIVGGALAGRIPTRATRQRWVVAVMVAVVALVPTLHGLDVPRTFRAPWDQVNDAVRAAEPSTIVVGYADTWFFATMAWPIHHEYDWYRAAPDNFERLLGHLRDQGTDHILVVSSENYLPETEVYARSTDVTPKTGFRVGSQWLLLELGEQPGAKGGRSAAIER